MTIKNRIRIRINPPFVDQLIRIRETANFWISDKSAVENFSIYHLTYEIMKILRSEVKYLKRKLKMIKKELQIAIYV